MKIPSSNKIKYYLKQPEFRPAIYLSPILFVLLVILVLYLPGVWVFVSSAIIFIVFAIIVSMSWRLSVVDSDLKLKNAQTFSIIENLNSGIIAYDTDFIVSIFNPAAEEIFNVSKDEIIGKKISPAMAGDNKYKLLAQTIFTTLAPKVIEITDSSKFPHVMEISFDDSQKYFRIITDRVYDKKGNIIGFIKIVIDKTRERSLLKAKDEFIEVAAHQLRTPLTAVNWALESLVKSKNLSEEDKNNAIIAFDAVKRMLETGNDLLDVSKIEEGRFGYNFQKTDIESFLAEILKKAMPVAKEYGINLYFKRPNKKYEVFIDQQKMSLVVTNLLENAIKYNVKNGSVTVSVDEYNDPNFVMVSVEDTGVGIPEKEKQLVFEKFKRGESASQIVPNGTGLGLYIAKNVVERHGGKIWFESEVNRGTTFYFTIPTNMSVIPKRDLLD